MKELCWHEAKEGDVTGDQGTMRNRDSYLAVLDREGAALGKKTAAYSEPPPYEKHKNTKSSAGDWNPTKRPPTCEKKQLEAASGCEAAVRRQVTAVFDNLTAVLRRETAVFR